MNIPSSRKGLIALALSVVCAVPVVASASINDVDVRSIKISYADLDVTGTTGQEVLYQRVRHAALKVCGSSNRKVAGSLRQAHENRQCYKDAVNGAINRIGIPALKELHAG